MNPLNRNIRKPTEGTNEKIGLFCRVTKLAINKIQSRLFVNTKDVIHMVIKTNAKSQ